MKTTTEYLSDTKVRLTISVGVDELEAAGQVALRKLARTVKAPGFRKGHVPMNVAAKYVDQNELAQESVDNVLSKAVAEAFVAENIHVLERPAVEIKKFVPAQELEFTAEAEVLPKVKLGAYKNLKATKAVVKVEPSDINAVLERLRSSFAAKKPVKRAAKLGDETTIDFVGKREGVAFDGGTGTDYQLVLGSNSFIPGFEEAIVGHKTGDKFDIDLKFPDDYQVADLASQSVIFTTTLKQIVESELPELTDELAAKAGPFTSVSELKADIKKELKAQKERDALSAYKDDLVRQVVEKSQVSVPSVLRADQIQSIEQDLQQNLGYQGTTFDTYLADSGFDSREDWVEKYAGPAADDRVKAGLVLAELSRAENVVVSPEDLAERIAVFKKQYADQPETAKRFDEPEVQTDVMNRLATEKTVDRLVELNK